MAIHVRIDIITLWKEPTNKLEICQLLWNTHLLPCPGGVPRPVSGGGGATAGRRGNRAIECGWRGLGRGGNTAGVGGSVLDTTRGSRGGTKTGFEFAFTFMAMGDSNLTIFLWQTVNTKTLFPMRR